MILITVRVGIYLTCGSHRMTESFHKEDFFFKGGFKTSQTPPLFIGVPVPSQESDRSCICVLRMSIFPLSVSFLLDFGTVCSDSGYFFPLYFTSKFAVISSTTRCALKIISLQCYYAAIIVYIDTCFSSFDISVQKI